MTETARSWALVTGGSSGIGFELARTLAEEGHDVVIAAYDIEKLEQAAELLRERAPDVEIDTVAADLASEEGVYSLHRELGRKGRRVGILCANAGVGSGGGDFTETDLDKELELIDLNVRGQVQLTKLVVRDMIDSGGGKILITSSIAGIMPGPFEAVYAASKSFIRSFGAALRNELAEKNIGVTVFMPGPTETDFFTRAGMDETPAGQSNKDDPAQVAEQAVAALKADKHAIVTGSFKTRMQGKVARMLSDPARASIHRKQTEPFDRQSESDGGVGAATLGGLFFVGAVAAAGTAAWLRSRNQEADVDARTRSRLRDEDGHVVPQADFEVGRAG
jgi:short-subunit dehydrogenase